jgi:hypothetical protein
VTERRSAPWPGNPSIEPDAATRQRRPVSRLAKLEFQFGENVDGVRSLPGLQPIVTSVARQWRIVTCTAAARSFSSSISGAFARTASLRHPVVCHPGAVPRRLPLAGAGRMARLSTVSLQRSDSGGCWLAICSRLRGVASGGTGHLAIPQRFQERESGWVGETLEKACADTRRHAAPHLRRQENDTSATFRLKRRVVCAQRRVRCTPASCVPVVR